MSIAIPVVRRRDGFTIVELLIVIVVIGILAAITIVAYNGIQQRGRDAQRSSDIATIQKALELYYLDNGVYPLAGAGGSPIDTNWATTADTSWQNLASALVPKYISSLPKDPISKPFSGAGNYPWTDPKGYDYSYISLINGACGVSHAQGYILVWNYEARNGATTNLSSCTPTTVGPYGGATFSTYYSLKK